MMTALRPLGTFGSKVTSSLAYVKVDPPTAVHSLVERHRQPRCTETLTDTPHHWAPGCSPDRSRPGRTTTAQPAQTQIRRTIRTRAPTPPPPPSANAYSSQCHPSREVANLWLSVEPGDVECHAAFRVGTQISAGRPAPSRRSRRLRRPASTSAASARSISRAFLLRLKRSRTSVRVIPSPRSLASAQISSAVGSPRVSPNTQRVLLWA